MLVSTSPRLRPRRERHGMRLFLVSLALLSVPAAALACKGGIAGKSPENPTAVLAIIGGAAVGWRSLMARIRQ